MLLSLGELVAQVVTELPADLRSIVESHYLEGASVYKIQRQRGMKRREVEAILTAALEMMRTTLRRQGIDGIWDVL